MDWTPTRIRTLRDKGLRLTQEEFGNALKYSTQTIGNVERGKYPPRPKLQKALDKALADAAEEDRERFFSSLLADSIAVTHAASIIYATMVLLPSLTLHKHPA